MVEESSQLVRQHYDNREGKTFFSEKLVIRPIDPKDLLDRKAMEALDRRTNEHNYFQKSEPYNIGDWIEYESMTADDLQHGLLEWLKDKNEDSNRKLFGIAWPKEGVPSHKRGELMGFVYVYPITSAKLWELRQKNLIPPIEQGQHVLELSYVRRRAAPHGDMDSAVRQVCMMISQANGAFHQEKQDRLLAHFEERIQEKRTQGWSEKRLVQMRRNWEKKFMKPRQIIMAQIDPSNERSLRMIEKAGFEYKGRVEGTHTSEPYFEHGKYNEFDDLYVLNWDRLHQQVQAEADKQLFGDSLSK